MPPAAFLEACLLFEHLIALVLPNECRAERVRFHETSLTAEVRIWQGEDRLFSLWLEALAAPLVVDQWQQFLDRFQRKRKRLRRPLTDEELRLLARPSLLAVLRALDDMDD